MPEAGRFIKILKQSLTLVLSLAAAAWLLINIYVTESFTWKEVYDFFSLETASQETSTAEEAQPESSFAGEGQEASLATETPLEGELLRVVFLSVGQGDCIFLSCGGENAFIDAGDLDASGEISAFLGAEGISELKYLFSSHPHIDHIGSMDVILNACEVGQYVMTSYSAEQTPTFATYGKLIRQLLEKGTPASVAQPGEVFALGGAEISVLSAGGFEDLNNSSLVLRCDYGESSFLFTGDIEFECEQTLLASGASLDCDVLKIAHHGSDDATSGAFYAAASPEIAVICCGLNNQYGFPDTDVLNIIERSGAALYRTDTDGDVAVLSDGVNISVTSRAFQ
ncbi:MAG: MBL fold metallo-hydrolase [Oscillospiraceae bacterium]|nr:MBL fold metallo-hydrolase [Oscillospiraceae bacterium]